jgi:ABC-type multidrug transport system ATPase subunit
VEALFRHVADLRDGGQTILLVEQLAEQALAIADHVTVMDNGEIIRAGLPAEFADRTRLEEAYFGVSGTSEPAEPDPAEPAPAEPDSQATEENSP